MGWMNSTSSTLRSEPQKQSAIPRLGWLLWLIGIALLFTLLHRNFTYRMFFIAAEAPTGHWWEAITNVLTVKVSGDWSHALVVPFISDWPLSRSGSVGPAWRSWSSGCSVLPSGYSQAETTCFKATA
jgi:hypothetical protein